VAISGSCISEALGEERRRFGIDAVNGFQVTEQVLY